jgi:hypothetical protein
MKTKKFRYSSPANISFRGVLDTGVELDEWDAMLANEQNEHLAELVFDRLLWLEDADTGENA